MHNIFAGPMGIKSQSKKHSKKEKKVQKCHINSLVQMESACVLKEKACQLTFMYNIW